MPVKFTPRSGPYKDQPCEGAAIVITDRASINSMLMGFEIAYILAKLYPELFHVEQMMTLVGSSSTITRLKNGDAPNRIFSDEDPALNSFLTTRSKYLIYH